MDPIGVSSFDIPYQLPVFYLQGDPLGAPLVPKNKNMLNFNNFSTTRPISDLTLSQDVIP